MGRTLRSLGAAILAATFLFVGVASRAQDASTVDNLQEQLDSARNRIASIQERADTVEEQVASIDKQIDAVEDALAATDALVERTQAELGLLRAAVDEKQERYDDVRARAVDIAVSLYKAGPAGNLEPLLGAKSLDELSSAVEYSSAVSEDQISVMVSLKRLQAELEAESAALEVKLAEALEIRNEQRQQSQHLRELRVAQRGKLADLRKRIVATRSEADSIAARSAAIEAQLADEEAPEAPAVAAAPGSADLSSGASGFAWPINGAITSGYGPRWGRTHSGIDIDCVTGDPIRASKSGTVVSSSYDADGYGYHLVIDHGGGFASLYAHASRLYVSGGSVSQGDAIAACGSTGASTGDHLHFEIRVNGTPQDPMAYLP